MTIEQAQELILKHKTLKQKKEKTTRLSAKVKIEHEMAQVVKQLLDNEVWECSICKCIFIGYINRHNAAPVTRGCCCDKCNREVVIPERIKILPR